MRRLVKALVVTIGAVLITGILPMGVAGADNGNNLPGCSNGEICMWYDTGSTVEKQFWWTNWNHGNFQFMCNCSSYYILQGSAFNVHDNVHDITNKDTQCWVKVGNFDGINWVWQEYANNWARYYLGNMANRNDAHVRTHNPGCG